MKKKKLKNSTVKAYEVVNSLKANIEILKDKGQDITFIKVLETSVKKMDRQEKELVTLKERVRTKKDIFEQEKEITLELVKNAKKVLKKEVGIEQKPEKGQEPEKEKKTEKEKPEKEKKDKEKQKPEKDIEKQTPEIAEEAEEPK